jgi:hypothetical protein
MNTGSFHTEQIDGKLEVPRYIIWFGPINAIVTVPNEEEEDIDSEDSI